MSDGNGHAAPIGPLDERELRSLSAAITTSDLRALENSILLERYRFMRQAGITFKGARDEYEILGYDRIITNRQYRDEYHRGGIAGRVVDAPVNATWRGSMELIEDEDPEHDTEFEQAWRKLDVRLQIQAKLRRVDKLAGLSTYAVLLIGSKGKGGLETELPKAKGPDDLIYLTPFSGGGGPQGIVRSSSSDSRMSAMDADASIFEFDVDFTSERFGLPLSYTLRRTDISSPTFAQPVHWSRIIHVAEDLLDDEVYGLPALERVWNLLADLRKVTGGGAEAFWLRANQGLHLNIDKDMAPSGITVSVEKLKEQADAYKHQMDRWLRTFGVDVKTLGSDVANFANPAEAILTQIAGAKAIPKRILTGSEMGELASSQDRDNWKDQVNGRQTGHAGPYIVRPLVDRLIRYGYLPTPKKGPNAYEVRWPHIQTLTEQEKVEGAKGWAAVNSTQGSIVFTDEEIRDKWEGMAPLTDEQRAEIAKREQEKVQAQADAQAMMQAAAQPPPLEEVSAEDLPADDELFDAEEEEKELKAAGGPGSGIVGHDTPLDRLKNTGIVGGKVVGPPMKLADSILGGTEQRKKATIGTLKKLPLVKLQQLVAAYAELAKAGKKQEVYTRARQVLAYRTAPVRREAEQFRASGDHKLSSTQVQLPSNITNKILEFAASIPDEDLAEDGREDEPHVTLQYGITSNDPTEAREVLSGLGSVALTLGKTSVFAGNGHEVVYVDVISPDLRKLNKLLSRSLDVEDTYPRYIPHATIAYVKPGLGQKYAGDDRFEGMTAMVDEVEFRPAEGEAETIELRAAGDLPGHPFYGNQWTDGEGGKYEVERVGETTGRSINYQVKVGGISIGRVQKTRAYTTMIAGPRTSNIVWRAGPGGYGSKADYSTQEEAERALIDYAQRIGKLAIRNASTNQWRETPKALTRTFQFADRRQCASFLAALMQGANLSNHHPDVETISNGVTVTWTTHDAGDTVTDLDRQAAERTDRLFATYGQKLESLEEGDEEIIRVLAAAIEYGATEVIDAICGIDRALGGPGSGNFGHAGRPGEVGGSSSDGGTMLDRPGGKDTLQRHTVDGRLTPERKALHDDIVRRVLGEHKRPDGQPIANLMGGGGASGKSVMQAELDLPKDQVHVDVDIIRTMLPEWKEELDAAKAEGRKPNVMLGTYTHKESSLISKRVIDEASGSGFNLLIDGVGDTSIDKVEQNVARYKAGGQRVAANYVTVDYDQAYARMRERGDKIGRYIPAAHLREVHAEVARVFPEAVRRGLFDEHTLWDTSDSKPLGGGKFSKPVKVASGKGRELIIHDQAAWDRFIERGKGIAPRKGEI